MNMASRNIANMHLFLEMKKKFPDLPEDTLRDYVLLYADDQDKCISLLEKESKNYFHSSQLFSDFHLFENRAHQRKSENARIDSAPGTPDSNAVLHENSNNIQESVVKPQQDTLCDEATASTSCIYMPVKSVNSNVPPKPKMQPNPSYNWSVSDTSKPTSVSSHTALHKIPSDKGDHNRMMFSTTKEHTILPLELPKKNKESAVSNQHEVEPSKRHAVSLSITPSFPFAQQQTNAYSTAVCSTSTHSSKPGRHTTSLNLQLQPHTSDPYPLEISTIPTNLGSPSNYSDYGSHLHISVGSHGATFTALRLQRPPVTQNQLPSPGESSFTYSQSSSHVQNSKGNKFPTQLQISSSKTEEPDSTEKCDVESAEDVSRAPLRNGRYTRFPPSTGQQIIGNLNAQTNFFHGYQASPDYIKAAKKHQLAQLDLLREELDKEKKVCSKLKYEVNKLEQDLLQKRETENSVSYIEALKKLKEENIKLRVDCNCLLMEYDMCSKGQIPVGMTDEDFYSNIFMGPNDGLSLYSSGGELKAKDKFRLAERKPKLPSEEEEEEKNKWLCKNCTFANHPALKKCEICELPKNTGSFFDVN